MDEKIGLAVERLREVCEPKRIILFGSVARGEQTSNSDFDFLVVVDKVSDLIEQTAVLRKALDDLDIAIDVALTTEERFQSYKNSFGHLYYVADKEGRILYDQVA